MKRGRAKWVGLLLLAFGCGSSSGAAPIDPVATAYCAACSEIPSCERVVNETINANCTDETRAWYSCATENACDTSACDAEWDDRKICMGDSPAALVRDRMRLLAPSANLGHRGTGPTRAGHPFPENSLSSFLAAMDAGAGLRPAQRQTRERLLLLVSHRRRGRRPAGRRARAGDAV